MLKHLKSPEVSLLSLAVMALLIFIPLYPKFPLFNVPQTYVAIRIEDLLVVLVFIIWFAQQCREGFSSLKDKVGQLIIFYWAVGLLSLLGALLIHKSVVPHLALLHWLRRIEYMFLFFVAVASVKSIENIKSYGVSLLVAAAGVGIYAIGQKFFSWPVISTMNEEFSKGMLLQLSEWARVNSTFAGHYDLATFLVLILALIVGFLFGLENKIAKLAVLLTGLFSFYILILTSSRVSFIAYLISITFVLVILKKYRWIGPVLIFSLMGIFLSTDLSQRYAATFHINLSPLYELYDQIPKIKRAEKVALAPTPTPTLIPLPIEGKKAVAEKTKPVAKRKETIPVATEAAQPEEWKPTTELAVEYSSGIRFNVEWPRAIRAFAKEPFLGTGYSSVTLATDNDYLRLLAETGLFGFFAFFMIFGEIGRRVISFLKNSKPGLVTSIVVAISGAAIGLLANATFIDVFEASKVAFIFWILMGILIGVMKITKDQGQDVKNN